MNTFKDKGKRKSSVSFNLENKHFRNLHLLLYLASLTIVLVFYTLTLLVFNKSQFAYILMVVFSVCVGIFLVFRKDAIVKQMSNELDKRKRNDIRRQDNINLKKTLCEVGASKSKRNIGSRNKNLKLNIMGKTSFQKRVTDMKKKFVKKNQNQKEPQYIEIK
jgi:c-di-AMP phosphodiesterase-like protein